MLEEGSALERWEEQLRFQVSLFNTVLNSSGARVLDGKLDIVVASPSPHYSCSILRAAPSPRIESKTEGNTHALVKIPVLAPEEDFDSRILVEYRTSPLSFNVDGMVFPSDQDLHDEYLRERKFWEIRDPLIKRTAERIRRSSSDEGQFLSSTFAWVRDNVKLRDPQPTRLGAARAIREMAGDCDELSDLFIAICRAAGVPSRRVVGLLYHGSESGQKPYDWHAWAEVRAAQGTWIPFDPSLGFLAGISERHLPRCCMGRQSDYPIRDLTWRSHPSKLPVLNDDDVESINVVASSVGVTP